MTPHSIRWRPGIYSAVITVSASGFSALTIPVTLSVGAALSIIPSPASLTFSVPGATVQTVQLLGNGGIGDQLLGGTSSVSGGGSWLSATANATYTPATLTVTVNPLNVAARHLSGQRHGYPLTRRCAGDPRHASGRREYPRRQPGLSRFRLYAGRDHASAADGAAHQPAFERHLHRPSRQHWKLAAGEWIDNADIRRTARHSECDGESGRA